MSIKKDIFAPWSKGLGATRRAAMLLLVMMLTTATAWATTTSTINVGGTDYTLFTGFTATSGTEGTGVYVYGNMVDGDLSTSWLSTSDSQPYHVELYYVEFNSDDLIIPKGYIFNVFSADNYKPTGWTLKAKANEGDSWTELSIYSDQILSGTEHSYSCNNSSNTKYKYFRFEVSANSNNIWLTEIRLYGFTELTYTHLSVKAATCTETGIKQECWQRIDGKYFTDNTGTTELSASVVIEPMISHTGVHHEASANNVEYWQCSMCNKYFSDSGCTNEITEAQTQVVKYLAADGTLTTLNENATAVTSSTTNWSSGWYVVYDDVTIADRISVSGTVNLILFDGATLTTSNGIGVGSDATYNVYAQSTDEATMGVLTATVSNTIDNCYCAAIGGGNNTNFGTITINGGKITATGHNAGIGGGYGSNSGNITINGGIVVANAGEYNNSAGIGGGNNGYVNSITLNGGIITATGDAQYGGAGIGTGSYAGSGTMTITITSGVKQIVATKGYSSDCIGKESNAQTTVNVVFKHNNTEVTGDDKNAVLYDTGDGVHRIIVPKDKKDKIIADIPDQIYTGSEIKPEPLVRVGSLVFTKGTDYEYSYTNNTNVGTAKVIVTFKGTNASQGSVEKEFTILPSTVMVSVTGSGTVTCGDRSATDGTSFGVMSEKGASVVLTLAPTDGNAVRNVAYGYTKNSGMTASGLKLPISGTTATLTVSDELKDGTGVTVTVTFAPALNGGADEASAVALTDATVTDLGGGWYKVENDISFDHTLNLLGDTYLTIAEGKTMSVNTTSGKAIDSEYTLNVSGEGALNITTSEADKIAVRVGSYVQTGATVTANGYHGIRCKDNFDEFNVTNDFTFSGGQLTATDSGGDGIWADNDITLSCTNATDFIQASSYSSAYGDVKIAEGKALTDGTEASNGMNGYSGTLTNEQRIAIGGKTLRRAVITSYVDASGTLHENVIAIPLDNTMTTLAAGWYVVNSDVDYTGTVTLSGDVTLILGDDCTMSIGKDEQLNGTIIECDFNHLTIYGQSGGTGWLKAYSAQDYGIKNVYYTQYSGNVLIFDGNGACIYASEFTILGGTLDLESQGGGADGEIVTTGNINIRGGKLWARCKGLKTMNDMIILDYTNATDQIYVIAYNPQHGLQIANGKTLVDDYGVIWSGTLNDDQIEHGINGRTLKPLDYTGVTLTKEGNNVSATFSGLSETTVSIPVNVNVTSVTYNRTFTDGRPSTVMLPFNKAVSEISGGTFYTFGGVEKKNNKWVATMNAVTGSLTANTPYLFVPAGMSLTFTGGATLNTTGGGNCLASDTEGWEFHGTYSKKLWNEVETHDYGFAATSGTSADNQDVEAGQFVRLTTGASAKPMRCYLSYVGGPAQARALTRGAAATDEELPSSIIVRLVGANGQTTGIGTIDNGQLTIDNYADADGWYDLQGRKLSGKPTKSGLYIKNGKKFVIK